MNNTDAFSMGYWMAWFINSDKNPFDYFEKKYGRKPTEVVLGRGVNEFDVPKNIKITKLALQPPRNQIWIR